MKLCLGTIVKLLYCCKKDSVNNVILGQKLFPSYEDIIDDKVITDPFVGKIKSCTNDLPPKYRNAILGTDIKLVKRNFEKIAAELVDSVIDQNMIGGLVSAILHTIRNDESLQEKTTIGYEGAYVKYGILREQNIDLICFLANILYYVYVNSNNKEGKKYISEIDKTYILKAIEEENEININIVKSDSGASKKKSQVNRKHPFTFNSNSCAFWGRDEEIRVLKEFIMPSDINIRWFSISGPGGCGKSRLAFEFMSSLNKMEWDSYILTRDVGLSFETLSSLININKKNIFIIVDTETPDMEALARWMSYQYSRMFNVEIRILICQRLPKMLSADELTPWYLSLVEYNEIVPSFEFVTDNSREILLNPLSHDVLRQIAASYISIMYPDYVLGKSDIDNVLDKLMEIDNHYCRPLYLLFISDAIANNNIQMINGEDALLNYAFERERSYIRNSIRDAFGCDYLHNKNLYDVIERSVAETACMKILTKGHRLSGYEEVGMNREQFEMLTDNFGLTENGIVKPIEPDLLAEYFYIRYADKFCSVLDNQDFWVRLFRDFNYLLTTKYRDILKQFFPYANISLGLYYVQGLYEAFCSTKSKSEKERIFNLLNGFQNDFCEWIGNDELLHPFGPEMTMNMFFMMNGERINKIKTVMRYSLEGNMDSFPKQTYKPFDSFIGDYASSLYSEIEEMMTTEKNAIPFVDKINEFTKLYEESKERESEVTFYYVHALFCALIFFFARGLEYEDKLASQIARLVPMQLKTIYEQSNIPEALMNYIKALMTLYTDDSHEFYQTKENLLGEIVSLFEKYGDDPLLYPIFSSFFEFISL